MFGCKFSLQGQHDEHRVPWRAYKYSWAAGRSAETAVSATHTIIICVDEDYKYSRSSIHIMVHTISIHAHLNTEQTDMRPMADILRELFALWIPFWLLPLHRPYYGHMTMSPDIYSANSHMMMSPDVYQPNGYLPRSSNDQHPGNSYLPSVSYSLDHLDRLDYQVIML